MESNTLFLDRILTFGEDYLRAQKTFSSDDEIFSDHFPSCPIVPGSLLIESMSQACSWLISCEEGFKKLPILNRLEQAKFRKFVRPGEKFEIKVMIGQSSESIRTLQGQVWLLHSKIAQAEFHFVLVPGSPDFAAAQRERFKLLLEKDNE